MSYVLAKYEMYGKMLVSAPQNAGQPKVKFWTYGTELMKHIHCNLQSNTTLEPIEIDIM